MRNKLYIVVFIIALILIFIKFNTFYSGTYYSGSVNEVLVLNSNNSFEISINNYKDSITISGKYQI